MKRLILLRHAKSDYPDGVSDHERPLAPRGQRDAPRMGREIARRGLQPRVDEPLAGVDLLVVGVAHDDAGRGVAVGRDARKAVPREERAPRDRNRNRTRTRTRSGETVAATSGGGSESKPENKPGGASSSGNRNRRRRRRSRSRRSHRRR